MTNDGVKTIYVFYAPSGIILMKFFHILHSIKCVDKTDKFLMFQENG